MKTDKFKFERELFVAAQKAARKAFDECKPIPMIVGEARGLFGNEIVPGTEEFVSDGVCGFAWVRIKPARGSFVAFLKSKKIGRSDDYLGGYTIWSNFVVPGDYTQSMQRKSAACDAFANMLCDAGINAWSESRMD